MAAEKTAKLKIGVLSGAVKNAGDFLIVKRGGELLRQAYPDAELSFFNRNQSLEGYLYELNKMDALVFCGGPMYMPSLYPQGLPLVSDLSRIQVPLFALGLGWFGSSGGCRDVYQYRFDAPTLGLFQRIERDTHTLGCRDWLSVNVLRNNGIFTGKMTGCPAWYDLAYVGSESFRSENPQKIKTVCISDPSDPAYLGLMVSLAAYARRVFPSAQVRAVFHRGLQADAYTGKQAAQMVQQAAGECRQMGVECMDISYGHDGFSAYDGCGLHIGFRVHAHIYNLSRRNLSVLIEEDGRGAGVNRALGLEGITAYEFALKSDLHADRARIAIGKTENTYLLQMVDDYLNNLFQDDFLQVRNAFRLMQGYYQQMKHHIEGLCKYI